MIIFARKIRPHFLLIEYFMSATVEFVRAARRFIIASHCSNPTSPLSGCSSLDAGHSGYSNSSIALWLPTGHKAAAQAPREPRRPKYRNRINVARTKPEHCDENDAWTHSSLALDRIAA
jgi:hypothetical protein